jgi:hypothetical protein
MNTYMNYDLIGQTIINRGKTRTKVRGDNLHKHRIKPGKEGGTYEESNVTLLTRKEHRIIHKIRYRLYGRRHDLAALTFLGGNPKTSWNKGISRSKEAIRKQQQSIRKTLATKGIWNKGIPCSDEAKVKLSKSLIGRRGGFENHSHSIEARKKISEASKGRKLQKVECPYCFKTGAKPVMNRFHFTNCKFKPEDTHGIHQV